MEQFFIGAKIDCAGIAVIQDLLNSTVLPTQSGYRMRMTDCLSMFGQFLLRLEGYLYRIANASHSMIVGMNPFVQERTGHGRPLGLGRG